ncbi:TolC family protein [Clostridium scatologenes]|uniref:Outer membrane efflux protein n=1 Tax=Clostridium scatologenes TaxID=1548 RepID=A0A0E3K300_CLOSL|nr:TolC family protein [Clostridium scatologenes]AKA70843.1 hypothetical protein CSCA_3718 [Clostridium scatologenes]
MKKNLSFLIALAMSLTVSTSCLAATNLATASDNNNKVTSINISDLTLDKALNSVEDSSLEVQSLNKKIDSLKKVLDNDQMQVTFINVSNKSQSQYPNGKYAGVMIQKEVTPLLDQKNIDDTENSKNERVNSIKFDLEKQYMNAITAKNQIDNINKNIADLDEQIKQTQAKIDLGQLTKDSVNSLNVQKSQLVSQLSAPYTQQQQAILNIKKSLNMDLNTALNLADAKKNFVKFNDADIEDKIKEAVSRDYNLKSIQKNIDIQKIQVDIQTKYAYNSLIEPMNSKLTLEDLQNKVDDTVSNSYVSFWKAYYALKNKEDNVQAQLVAQESAQLAYNKALASFNNGMIDKVSLDSAELSLNTQKVATQQAINDYMITQGQFNYALDGHSTIAANIGASAQ